MIEMMDVLAACVGVFVTMLGLTWVNLAYCGIEPDSLKYHLVTWAELVPVVLWFWTGLVLR